MLNLTPHAITIRVGEEEVTIPPSGVVARVVMNETPSTAIDIGIQVPVIRRTPGDVVGLPTDGTPCLVSSLVLDAAKGVHGVFAPDTGPTAIRNDKGLVMAVTRLVAA